LFLFHSTEKRRYLVGKKRFFCPAARVCWLSLRVLLLLLFFLFWLSKKWRQTGRNVFEYSDISRKSEVAWAQVASSSQQQRRRYEDVILVSWNTDWRHSWTFSLRIPTGSKWVSIKLDRSKGFVMSSIGRWRGRGVKEKVVTNVQIHIQKHILCPE